MTLSEIKCRTITITEQLQLQLNYATMHIKQFSHLKNLSIHRKIPGRNRGATRDGPLGGGETSGSKQKGVMQ